jgi:signal transduction histidine kinase
MSVPRASSRIGLFALLLGVIVLSLFGSLVAADRALSNADRESIALDAHGASLVVERELRLRSEALAELFGPLLSRPASGTADTTAIPPGFDAAWVLDTTGAIVWRSAQRDGTTSEAAIQRAGRDAIERPGPHLRVATGAPSANAEGLLLAMSLYHRGQRLGAAVGRLPGQDVIGILQDRAAERRWVALRAGDSILAVVGDRDLNQPFIRAASQVRLPGDRIAVEVAHSPTGRTLRTALWMLGVAGIIALLAAFARERRHTIQLASRTNELERLYQEVARSNRMKSEFLANVSHELRTPLNAVVGFVEMLREGVYGELSPRQALPVDRIAASATHLRHLVDRLLDIAKIAAGRLEVHTEPLVLRPFVLNVASEMESLVSERGLALSIGVAPSLPRIRTDQTHLRQILINLIGNAVKYTPSGGIQVRAKLLGNGATPATPEEVESKIGNPPDPQRLWVALQVSDTGLGIATADLERIFDEFEQVNAGARTDSARRGTGLGLAISRRLARLLGGDLTVVSELGRGSTFTVWLPLGEAEKL